MYAKSSLSTDYGREGRSGEPFFVLRFQLVVKCLLIALAIDLNNLTKNRNSIRTIDGWALSIGQDLGHGCSHCGMCRRGYGGSAWLWWWEHSAAPSGPGSSTSSAGWLCPASLLVSLVAFSTAFLHLWSRPSFFQSESAGISWATS